jgi:hypothetical protein
VRKQLVFSNFKPLATIRAPHGSLHANVICTPWRPLLLRRRSNRHYYGILTRSDFKGKTFIRRSMMRHLAFSKFELSILIVLFLFNSVGEGSNSDVVGFAARISVVVGQTTVEPDPSDPTFPMAHDHANAVGFR